jgi:CTD kinase subunit gamma
LIVAHKFRPHRASIILSVMPLDPFEGRLQFLEQLKHLSASQSSSLKLAQFALKNRALHEDLYSCIIEKLSSTTLNDKINIFYFLGTLVDQSERAQFGPYGDMVRRDLDRIVSDVAPVDGGAVNIPPAKKVCLRSCRSNFRSSKTYWTSG